MCAFCLDDLAAIAIGAGAAAGLSAALLGNRRAERDPQASGIVPIAEEKLA